MAENCFRYSNITSIVFPNTLKYICNSGFFGCRKLNNFTLPGSLEYIGVAAFSDCRVMTSLVIPEGVKVIDDRAFEECWALSSVTLPNSLEVIGEQAFAAYSPTYCKLTSLHIPKNVKEIGGNILYNNVPAVLTIDDENEIFTDLGKNSLYDKNTKTLLRGSNTLTVLPSDTEVIANGAYYKMTELPSITFPNTLLRIENEAFYYCENLKTIDLPQSLEYLGEFAFGYCSGLSEINIPINVTYVNRWAFIGCGEITTFRLHENVTGVDTMAFDKNSIVITNAFIDSKGFMERTYLSDVTIHNLYFYKDVQDVSIVSNVFTDIYQMDTSNLYDSNGNVWQDGVSTGKQYYKWVEIV